MHCVGNIFIGLFRTLKLGAYIYAGKHIILVDKPCSQNTLLLYRVITHTKLYTHHNQPLACVEERLSAFLMTGVGLGDALTSVSLAVNIEIVLYSYQALPLLVTWVQMSSLTLVSNLHFAI